MEIRHFTVGPFLEHTYVISDPDTAQAIVIDPGGWNEKVLSYLKEKKMRVTAIVSTHGHIDHIAGAFDLRKATQAPYRLNKKDEFMFEDLAAITSYFGFPSVKKPIVDLDLREGDVLELGARTLSVIETPGHTPGGLCFLVENHVFVGDTLFQGSVGRTDLPGGNYETLMESIRTKLLTLDGEMIVHCGHGPETTIGREKATNPFLVGGNASFF